MSENVDRRKFLQTVPAAAALAAGCQSDEPTDGDETRTTEPSTPSPDASTETYTPADVTIEPSVDGDVLSPHPRRARVIREFMPFAGAASIAVAFPAELTDASQAFCFDAGACRLQYAWSNGFIQIPYTKDDGPADIGGQLYYRPDRGFPLRFEEGSEPEEFSFEGYALVDRLPEFSFEADGVPVRQHFRPVEGGSGLRQTFRLPERDDPVWFVGDDEESVSYDASVGTWEGDRLAVDAADAEEFTVEVVPE